MYIYSDNGRLMASAIWNGLLHTKTLDDWVIILRERGFHTVKAKGSLHQLITLKIHERGYSIFQQGRA